MGRHSTIRISPKKANIYKARNHFLAMYKFRNIPSSLTTHEIITSYHCQLGQPEEVSDAKCALYLAARSPSCVDCLYSFYKIKDYLNIVTHRRIISSVPILRLYFRQEVARDRIEKELNLPVKSTRTRKIETKKSLENIKTASELIDNDK